MARPTLRSGEIERLYGTSPGNRHNGAGSSARESCLRIQRTSASRESTGAAGSSLFAIRGMAELPLCGLRIREADRKGTHSISPGPADMDAITPPSETPVSETIGLVTGAGQ